MSRAWYAVFCIYLLRMTMPVAYAADDKQGSVEISGYYNNLLVNSRTLAAYSPQQSYWVDLNRLRLEFKGDLGPRTRFDVQYDNEVFFGSYLETSQFAAQKNLSMGNYFDLRQVYVDNSSVFARHGLYRAYVDSRLKQADVRIGRQRIAWGSGLFWSPVDIINPFGPTQIEREERPGVDAVLLDWDYGQLSRISLAYAAHASPVRETIAARWRTNHAGFDLGLTAGQFRNEDMAGFDFAGQWKSLGLRGEYTQTSSPVDGTYQRVVFSADYTAPNTLSMFLELYYNGQGRSDPSFYQFSRLLSGEIQNLARNYLGTMVAYDFTPLVKWQNYYIRNLDDSSEFLYSRLVYSARENTEWSIGAQVFTGKAGSEYGSFENIALIQYRRYF